MTDNIWTHMTIRIVTVKFIYFEETTKVCEISTVDLTVTTQDKSTVEISQKFVAFSEYMNFTDENIFFLCIVQTFCAPEFQNESRSATFQKLFQLSLQNNFE